MDGIHFENRELAIASITVGNSVLGQTERNRPPVSFVRDADASYHLWKPRPTRAHAIPRSFCGGRAHRLRRQSAMIPSTQKLIDTNEHRVNQTAHLRILPRELFCGRHVNLHPSIVLYDRFHSSDNIFHGLLSYLFSGKTVVILTGRRID